MDKASLVTSLSSIENWQHFCVALVAIGIVGEFLLGLKYTSQSKALHKIEEREQQELNLKIESLRNKNLELEAEALKLRRFVREPRVIDTAKSKVALESHPAGSVDINYLDGNLEAERLANELQRILSRYGWTVSIRKVGTDIVKGAGVSFETGSKTVAFGGQYGVQFEEPGQTLYAFLQSCISGNLEGMAAHNPELSQSASVITIGSKVW